MCDGLGEFCGRSDRAADAENLCFDGMSLLNERCEYPRFCLVISDSQGFMRDGQLIEEAEIAKM